MILLLVVRPPEDQAARLPSNTYGGPPTTGAE